MLDHLGHNDGGDEFETWSVSLTALAALPNVIAKVSACYGGWSGGMQNGAQWSMALQRATMLFVLKAFPADRPRRRGSNPRLLTRHTGLSSADHESRTPLCE